MKPKRAPLTRSEVMSRVKGRDTKPEMRLRRALHAAGLRYRLQAKEVPGRPDIVFRPAKLAIFVHGCFWHRHPGCEHARTPKSRIDFWEQKLGGNVERDARQVAELQAAGWTVMTLWECETRDDAAIAAFVDAVVRRVAAAKKS
jgi:DNA mismatch endonuclease (patch repair protein)